MNKIWATLCMWFFLNTVQSRSRCLQLAVGCMFINTYQVSFVHLVCDLFVWIQEKKIVRKGDFKFNMKPECKEYFNKQLRNMFLMLYASQKCKLWVPYSPEYEFLVWFYACLPIRLSESASFRPCCAYLTVQM